jgi:hypothetical protein
MLMVALVLIRRRRKRTWWIHPINQKREELGEYHRLVLELRLDSERFIKYFRMTPDLFDNLLSKVGPLIQKRGSNFRKTLSASQRLAITLRLVPKIFISIK